MKIAKNAVKSWSFQAGMVLALLTLINEAMPTIAGEIPDNWYNWVTFCLTIAIPVVRLVKQRGVSGDD